MMKIFTKKIDKVIELSNLDRLFLILTENDFPERGLQVFGGEKQRIGIARALQL